MAEPSYRSPSVSCIADLRRAAGLPGWTVADLRPYEETVLAAFGPSRVMYGSDWPACMLAASYTDVVSPPGNWPRN